MQVKNSTFYTIVSFFVLCMLALTLRLMPLTDWIKYKKDYLQYSSTTVGGDFSLINSTPMMKNIDGFYYLAAAQQYLDGSYDAVENHRAIPDTVTRKPYPPMLSFLLATTSKISGISLDWIGVTLPAVLSLLVAIPLFFLGRLCANNLTGLLACAVYLFIPLVLNRATFGFLDTDCLNPFFPLTAIVCAIYFARIASLKRYLFFLVGIINWFFYLWWWDQSFSPPTVLGLVPLFLALLFCYRPKKKERLTFFVSIGTMVFITIVFLGFDILPEFFKSIFSLIKYISKQGESIYPPVGIHISEQTPMPIGVFIRKGFINSTMLLIAILGFCMLTWKIRREITLFLPLTAVGIFTILFANRFIIFLLPVLCLYFAFATIYCVELSKRYLPNKALDKAGEFVFVAIALGVCWNGFQYFSSLPPSTPVIKAREAAMMRVIKEKTPKNALIWSWWDSGHPLVYYAQRDTVNDGMVHTPERNYFTALPLTSKSDREAANFMNFYVEAGSVGYQKFIKEAAKTGFDGRKEIRAIFAGGKENISRQFKNLPVAQREKWQRLLFPTQRRPIYLYIPFRRSANFLLTHYTGTWDFHTKKGEKSLITVLLSDHREPKMPRKISERKDINLPEIKWDATTRTLDAPEVFRRPLQVESVWLTQEKCEKISSGVVKDKRNSYGVRIGVPLAFAPVLANEGIYDLDINAPKNTLVFQDTRITEDLLPRLFWRKKYDPKYFTPIDLRPDYQLWKVTSDMWNEENDSK